jgi:hypothetical protein
MRITMWSCFRNVITRSLDHGEVVLAKLATVPAAFDFRRGREQDHCDAPKKITFESLLGGSVVLELIDLDSPLGPA